MMNSKGTLLIVDDMPNNVKILHEFLREEGFEILVAYDGTDCIEVAEYAHPDLILLDVMMPDLSGFEVCQHLKSQPDTQDILIIFMTALSETVDKIKGFTVGGVDYLTKPLQQAEVLVRINTHLNLRKAQQQLQEEISIRKEAEQSLLETNKVLAERNAELDTFAHTIAHGLKNPLSSVMMLTEMLAEECTAETTSIHNQVLEKLRMIAQANKQMLTLIDGLILLAGVSKQKQLTFERLEMKNILDEVINHRLQNVIRECQARIDLPESWPLVRSYSPWVEEVWFNYLSNGLQYGGHPPHLQLGANIQQNNMVRFWMSGQNVNLVPDTSIFIATHSPQEQLNEDKLKFLIVQKIVEKLGGQTGIENTSDKDYLFFFTLPAGRISAAVEDVEQDY